MGRESRLELSRIDHFREAYSQLRQLLEDLSKPRQGPLDGPEKAQAGAPETRQP